MKKCIPCEDKNMTALLPEEVHMRLEEIPAWEVDSQNKKISRTWKLRNFVAAIDFVGAIADIAEKNGHHPDIHIFYDTVRLELYTHSIDGLSENDFIVAAEIDSLPFSAL